MCNFGNLCWNYELSQMVLICACRVSPSTFAALIYALRNLYRQQPSIPGSASLDSNPNWDDQLIICIWLVGFRHTEGGVFHFESDEQQNWQMSFPYNKRVKSDARHARAFYPNRYTTN